jgi:hypothetical protein
MGILNGFQWLLRTSLPVQLRRSDSYLFFKSSIFSLIEQSLVFELHDLQARSRARPHKYYALQNKGESL